MTCARTAGVLLSLLPALALAEMQALDDSALSEMSGQGGVYLSGEFSINKDGGVLWGTPTTNNPAQWTANQRSCALAGAATPESCGLRLAIRSGANAGWYVLDNLKGLSLIHIYLVSPINIDFNQAFNGIPRQDTCLGTATAGC